MKILTCNIRGFGSEDGPDNWIHRKGMCIDAIRSRTPDIICFQEMWIQQFADVSPALPDFAYYAMTDGPTSQHPMNCIMYRRETHRLISSGGYWMSETPHISGTRFRDSACVRFVNWVRLEDSATGIEFRVVNTHLDHINQPARENQARLITEDASAYPDEYPQILTGDMNCDTRNRAIGRFKQEGWIDTYGQVHHTENPGHTFHSFLGPDYQSETGKMDWIFTRGKVDVTGADIIMDSTDGRFPSDHYFVSATLDLGAPA